MLIILVDYVGFVLGPLWQNPSNGDIILGVSLLLHHLGSLSMPAAAMHVVVSTQSHAHKRSTCGTREDSGQNNRIDMFS